MIEIDGSQGEGGGQMLRTAAVLSLLTGKPFRMRNIRTGREKPGLKAQHLHVLKALQQLSRAEVQGSREGASEIEFEPAPLEGARFSVDVGTAGSITLILQSLIPAACLARGPSEIEITGGTDVRWSPTFDYFREVLLPRMPGAGVELVRRGFYPKGGGTVRLRVQPAPPPRLGLTGAPKIRRIRLFSTASLDLQKARVAERQAKAARMVLDPLAPAVEEKIEYCDSFSTGTACVAVAECEGGMRLGADALGERGKRAEAVGLEAARRLEAEIRSGAPVDRHAGDNLVLWLALGGGEIEVSEVTEHARTNILVCERFTGPIFRLEGRRISVPRPVAPASP